MNAPAKQPILLVEDTLTLAHVYKAALEKAGHEVECDIAGTGRQCPGQAVQPSAWPRQHVFTQ